MPSRFNMITGLGNEQQFLLPVNALEWLSENDVTYAILEILSSLDTRQFLHKYREDGRGEKSSRKIEMCCHYDIGYRIVANNLTPDHTTIYRFKMNSSREIKSLFKQLSQIIVECGIAQIGIIALDGSKFGCNASLVISGLLFPNSSGIKFLIFSGIKIPKASSTIHQIEAGLIFF